jgi:hypothetical protein
MANEIGDWFLTSGNQNWAGAFRQSNILLLADELHSNLPLRRLSCSCVEIFTHCKIEIKLLPMLQMESFFGGCRIFGG